MRKYYYKDEKIIWKWNDGNPCAIAKNLNNKDVKDITFRYLGYGLGKGVNVWVMDDAEFLSRGEFESALYILERLNNAFTHTDGKFVRDYMDGIKSHETPPPSKRIYGSPDIDMDHPGIIKGQKK